VSQHSQLIKFAGKQEIGFENYTLSPGGQHLMRKERSVSPFMLAKPISVETIKSQTPESSKLSLTQRRKKRVRPETIDNIIQLWLENPNLKPDKVYKTANTSQDLVIRCKTMLEKGYSRSEIQAKLKKGLIPAEEKRLIYLLKQNPTITNQNVREDFPFLDAFTIKRYRDLLKSDPAERVD
jgi:hypothetical protein